jgi:2-polyprenyl-6-hydroxyphenyl methylase/3-demethylubiquinone-9 3-methyltransferase
VKVDYRVQPVEALAAAQPGAFDAVTCMEMLEHVPEPARVVEACARLLKPGGWVFFSTINRTLVRPAELRTWAAASGLRFIAVDSLMYNPLTRSFRVAADREDVNYMACFVKPGAGA